MWTLNWTILKHRKYIYANLIVSISYYMCVYIFMVDAHTIFVSKEFVPNLKRQLICYLSDPKIIHHLAGNKYK